MSTGRRSRGSGAARSISVAFALACLLTACGSTPKASGPTTSDGATSTSQSSDGHPTSSTTTAGPTTTTTYYRQGKVIPKSQAPKTLPRESKGQAVPQFTGAGQQALIYPTSIWPEYLYANYKTTITWTNLTNRTQTITFFHIPFSSLPIPPGGQFIWKSPSGGVIGYHDSSGSQGELNLQEPSQR